MEWLNYHHLFYFWTVVREGGIAAASRTLHVGRPSISAQIKSLERFVGAPLFERRGPSLELTDTGRMVHAYAEEIFRAGRELVDAVRGRPTDRPLVLRVGVTDSVSKLVAFRLLAPVLEGEAPFALDCREGAPDRLFASLAVHELDLVLSDVPIGPSVDVKAYDHFVGESTATLFATPALAKRLRRGFPGSLDGAPVLMPSRQSAVRRAFEQWLDETGLRPTVVATFEDSALLKVFGHGGHGAFPAPTVVADAIERRYGVKRIAELDDVRERTYAISVERRIGHPAVALLVERARQELFVGS
ncbi:MAG: LysR family transcriptional regulator [Planctomycetota bacterium]